MRDFNFIHEFSHLQSPIVPEDTCSARKDLDDEDMLNVLERCYAVLHGRRNSNSISAASSSTTTSTLSIPNSLISKNLKRYVFDTVKTRITCLDHNLYDLIWPSVKKLPTDQQFRAALDHDFPTGLVAPDRYSYTVFREFIDPILKSYNSIDLNQELRGNLVGNFFANQNENSQGEVDLDLDPHNRWIISGTLDCSRNLNNYEFPKSLNLNELETVERLITTVLLSRDVAKVLYPNATEDELDEKGSGVYYTMNEVLEDPSEARFILTSNNLLVPLWNIPDSDRLHGKHWPYGRGVFVSNGGNLAVWINVLDHIRIVTCTPRTKSGNIGLVYSRVYRLLRILEERQLTFLRDERLGFVSSRPTVVGNTLQFCLTVKFPNLIKEPENLNHLCAVRGLSCCKKINDIVKIGNQRCLGVGEMQTFEDFHTAVVNILQLEKDLAMSNSLHIAAMFVNIFKKKKSLISDD